MCSSPRFSFTFSTSENRMLDCLCAFSMCAGKGASYGTRRTRKKGNDVVTVGAVFVSAFLLFEQKNANLNKLHDKNSMLFWMMILHFMSCAPESRNLSKLFVYSSSQLYVSMLVTVEVFHHGVVYEHEKTSS